MKKLVIATLSVLIVSVLSPASLSARQRGFRIVPTSGESLYLYKDYHALIVGVSDYDKWPDLPNAVTDAREVSQTLKRLGFDVKVVSDPTSPELKGALNDLTYRYGREENRALLFYYAGHGETEILADGTKLGYIIPRDCPLLHDDPQGFVNRAISMKDIEAYSLRIRSKHVLMLFDSCFSGSLFSLVRAAPEDITEKSSLPVRQYITAGTEDETVPDRSMFKRCLLLGLKGDADLTRDGYITGTELGLYLSDKVVQGTSRAQHPQYGKIRTPELARGDFIFALKGPSEPSAQVSAPSQIAVSESKLKTYEFKDAGFRAIFPAEPVEKKVRKKNTTTYKVTDMKGAQGYSVVATHLSRKPFSGIALAEKVFKKLTKTSTVKKKSYFSAAYGEGIESQIINDKGNYIDYRIVVVDDIIYQIMITSTKGFAYKSERVDFFNSFIPI